MQTAHIEDISHHGLLSPGGHTTSHDKNKGVLEDVSPKLCKW